MSKNDLISKQAVIDAIEMVDWYHQNQHKDMVSGANSDEHQAWYKAEDVYEAIEALPSAQPEQHERIFQEIVVEYPSISTYPEYEGKPYFSIKYVEDGRGYIGYGTYNPEVLSEYMKEYFIPSAEPKTGRWVRNFDGNEWYWFCSNCKEEWYEEDLWMGGNDFPNYCPHCGARMKGGDNG